MIQPKKPSFPLLLAFSSTAFLLSAAPAVSQESSELQALQTQVEQYEAQIEQLGGSYDQSSFELLRSMADIYIQLERYDDAVSAFRESLQALRINEGLASESQLTVLEEFNRLLFDLEQWDELDTNYHLATDMNARLYGFNDNRYAEAATSLASWKIRAYQTGVYEPKGDRSIVEAARVYGTLLRHLPPELAAARQVDFLSAQGLAYFYAARYTANMPINEFQGAPGQNVALTCVPTIMAIDGGATPSVSACQANQADPEYFASKQREKNNQVRGHLGNMRQSFQEAIEALETNPSVSVREQAQAILNYGDANLLAEDYQRARSQYARAYDLLSANDETIALRNELMDTPVKALQGILDELQFDQRLQGSVSLGTISFDVTEKGEIENINIEGTNEALDQGNIGAIAMILDQSVYRPRIVEGRPVVSRITVSAADL